MWRGRGSQERLAYSERSEWPWSIEWRRPPKRLAWSRSEGISSHAAQCIISDHLRQWLRRNYQWTDYSPVREQTVWVAPTDFEELLSTVEVILKRERTHA